MHNLFLGTAKYVMKQLWIEKRIVSLQQLKLIQKELILILLQPAGIRQIPQKITTAFGGFTAEQWKNWIILYSMYALLWNSASGTLQVSANVCISVLPSLQTGDH